MHLLEAGEEGKPLLLLLHGFPELAWSWRRVMQPLADRGYHVVAPDQRGYGRTTGWDDNYDGDLPSFRPLNLMLDVLSLVTALQPDQALPEAHAVVGHDFGSPVAAWCALLRPDVFQRLILMSAPFAGPPMISRTTTTLSNLDAALAALTPPRKHYRSYYCTRQANEEMLHAPQGTAALLRAYYHMKSADWSGNQPHPLGAMSAQALAELPHYYVMDLAATMAETVAPHLPDEAACNQCEWLPPADLDVYVQEYGRTGFQGGLNWYRAAGLSVTEQKLFAGRQIQQPSLFLAGSSDWGIYQTQGAFEAMQQHALGDLRGVHLIDGAGHWLQQEQPARLLSFLLRFLEETD